MTQTVPDTTPLPQAQAAPAPRLPLSKIVYGIGTSASDAWMAFTATFLALLPLIYFGGQGNGILKTIAESPDRMKEAFKGFLEKNLKIQFTEGGKFGNAFTLAFGVASVVGLIAHFPRAAIGAQKVAVAQKMYGDEVQRNQLLTEDNERLRLALADRDNRPSFSEKARDSAAAQAQTGAAL